MWEKIRETAFEVDQGAFQASGVPFSYSVIFTDSEIPWTHRWDAYLLTGGGQIHVFSTINSLVVAMLLTFVVAAILLRTIRNDISQYEAMLADEEGALEDLTGWKLVSGVSLSTAEMRRYIVGGARATWPKLGLIEDRLRIENALRDI